LILESQSTYQVFPLEMIKAKAASNLLAAFAFALEAWT
jgi:hypothetical protein